jgi:hypothetical protein
MVKILRYRHVVVKGEREYSSFLTSALDERDDTAALYSQERTPSTHWMGDWVDLRDDLNIMARRKILCLCRGSNLGRHVCSQALY